jgi:hypothetical protein
LTKRSTFNELGLVVAGPDGGNEVVQHLHVNHNH